MINKDNTVYYFSLTTQLLSDGDDESVEVDLEGLFSDMHIMYTGHYYL